MILAINASRAKSGGAKAHLIGILNEFKPIKHGFKEVHIWSYKELLEQLPDAPWLFKHSNPILERSLPFQIYWEVFKIKKEILKIKFDILLNIDAGTFARISPSVAMSRDMLSYEPGELQRYPWGYMRIRILALKYVQNLTFRSADGVIFLTKYASQIIQKSCGKLKRISNIPHGVGKNFFHPDVPNNLKINKGQVIKCIYVSPPWLFKHQWNVVEAIHKLKQKGHKIELLLVGGKGNPEGEKKLEEAILKFDKLKEYVTRLGQIPHDKLPSIIKNNNIFIFASSCENMPNTILEGMASKIPIACSSKGPMSEVLDDGGVYFDPEYPESIAEAIEKLILNEDLRNTLVSKSSKRVKQDSWSRCADETLQFLSKTYDNFREK